MNATTPMTMGLEMHTGAGVEAAPMRAVVQTTYGTAEVLRFGEAPRPVAGAGEVLVRVAAAGLDRGTWHLMAGKPYLMRIMGFGFRGPKQQVPGLDVAGTVVEVGPGVTRFAVGDEVFGISRGSFAELACAREDKLARRPAGLDATHAAVLGVSALTALQSLRDAGRLEAGQRVLVIGASGGVGSYAVQIAKAMGAEVTGVCSTAKLAMVSGLGADHVIDYTKQDFADGGARYDLILDIGGNASLSRLRRALTPRGTTVFVGGEGNGVWVGGMGRAMWGMVRSWFGGQAFRMFMCREQAVDLEALAALVEAGKLRPAVERSFALSEVPDAMRHLEAGRVRGKVAIVVGG